ncbi:MAG: sulfotransferase family 2 domain-containing protein [Verrucomicrobiota bacterium]
MSTIQKFGLQSQPGGALSRRVERFKFQVRHPLRYLKLRMQCERTRGIFVHIPKCAGTSIRKSLPLQLGGHKSLAGYHTVLPEKVFQQCLTFTFVRNPWDRLVSAFFFMKNPSLGSSQKWERRNLAAFHDFDSFVRGWVTPANVCSYSHFRPQFHYITLQNRLAVNFIGFCENLPEDFSIVCRKLNVPATLREDNCNPIRTRDYKEYYTDETRRIVAEVYAEDIALFGYSFDNASLPDQIAARCQQDRSRAAAFPERPL